MWTLLKAINKNLIYAIPVMMIMGFVYGIYFQTAFLKDLIIPFTILMVYPMMVNLKLKKVFEGGDTKAQLITQIVNFGVVPFLAYGIGLLFFKDQPYMALGMLLAGLVPTSGMTISWTGFAKGNLEAAVKMTVIGLTLGSIATPFYVQFLMGANIEVNIYAVMKQIVIIVFIPMIAGFITQQALIKKYGQKGYQTRWAPRFPSLSTIGVIGIVFIAMALKAKSIAGAPQLLLYILAPLALIYTINYILSTVIGKLFLPRGDAIALVYGSVMRNLSIALAIALNAFGPEGSSAALVIAISYIIQVQSAAWYVKFTDKIFGEKETEPEPETASEPPPCQVSTVPASAESEKEPFIVDIKKILYATDLSTTARHAVRYACSIGAKYNARVTVLHIVPDVLEEYSAEAGVDIGKQFGVKQWETFNRKGIETAKSVIQARVQNTYHDVIKESPYCPLSTGDIVVSVGNPSRTIVQKADEGGYDLIIMGAHGHNGFENVMMGSITSRVISMTQKPVLVVNLPNENESQDKRI